MGHPRAGRGAAQRDAGHRRGPELGANRGALYVNFIDERNGDTDVFQAPVAGVGVQIKDFRGNSSCVPRLFDGANGQALDLATATPGADTVTLDAYGRPTVYVYVAHCVVRVYAQP